MKKHIKILYALTALILSLSLSGCFATVQNIGFAPDGSFTYSVGTYYSEELLQLLEASPEGMEDSLDEAKDLLNESLSQAEEVEEADREKFGELIASAEYSSIEIKGASYFGTLIEAGVYSMEDTDESDEMGLEREIYEEDGKRILRCVMSIRREESSIINNANMTLDKEAYLESVAGVPVPSGENIYIEGTEDLPDEIDIQIDPEEILEAIEVIVTYSFPEGVKSVEGAAPDSWYIEGNTLYLDYKANIWTEEELEQYPDKEAKEIVIEGFLGAADENAPVPADEVPERARTEVPAEAGTAESPIPFTDVAKTDYFYDSVVWAYNAEPQITDGNGKDKFMPEQICTRGQVVTFLWRAAGCPEPASAENPFADVAEADYFYKPVLWAVEKGITEGTTDTTFSPAKTCSNAHILTFLYRAVGAGEDGWYEEAQAWAEESGLLEGTYTDTFDVNGDCPRANVIEYLYRYSKQ
ncbi:MAG: S-layer homology domain-containing protein [Firmicutes bacterium]|nr:S-layer homology domain-containing protein [Bacillota bacterium]